MSKNVISRWILVTLLLGVVVLAGCRESAQPTQTVEGYHISMEAQPQPPVVGVSTLLVSVVNGEGAPVNVSKLDVRGDMNHAGMVPVLRTIEEPAADGQFEVPFEWTMGGEWIVTVTATLDSDQTIADEFTLTVSREGAAGDMGDHEMDDNPMSLGMVDMDESEECGEDDDDELCDVEPPEGESAP